jgi:ribosomal protein S18 acetylase RimI-like enzyme
MSEETPVSAQGFNVELSFREGRASDEHSVRRILSESNLSLHQQSGVKPVSAIGSTRVHLLERNSEVLGVLQWRDLGEEVEILDLAVPTDRRRRGFGLGLLRGFVAFAGDRGVRQIFLEVRESNEAAIGLYRKEGFSLTGRRPNYYQQPQEAALLFHLEIRG